MKRFVAAAALASALGTGRARADTPIPVAPPSTLEAPRVDYPVGVTGEGVVLLEVLVDKAGAVADVRVVEGDEPFASAARDGVRGWTFHPALRGAVPVAARIRLRVEFHPPKPKAETANDANGASPANGANGTSSPTGAAVPAKTEVVVEVDVRGARTEVGQTQLGGAEVRQLPGAFGDAFRAIEALPGVTPILSGLPFFFVRGAPPGNVGYFVDGIRVPLLYHLALGPSVIHPGLIDHVDFYAGGYPARYGRYAGGILDGEVTPPASQVHGEANVRVFDSGALAEAPLLDGRLTALVAGRYSYTAALVQLFAKDTRVAYWDYQSRVEYKLSPHDRVSAFWFGSFDEIDSRDRVEVQDSTGNYHEELTPFYPVFKTEFHRLDLRYDHDTAHGHLRVAATLGVEDSLAGSRQTESTSVVSRNLQLRTEGEERLDPAVKLRYGADVLLDHYSIDTGQSSAFDLKSLYPDRNDVMIGAYADAIWKVSRRVEIVPGMRADVFTSRLASHAAPAPSNDMTLPIPDAFQSATATVGLDPRLATRVTLSRVLTWVSTFGVSHQPPALFVPIPGLTIGQLNTGLQTSVQASEGLELSLPADIHVTATGFYQQYLGLTDATATCLANDTAVPNASNDCLAQRVTGRAYGVELMVKRDLTKRLTGWVSYTLSRSTRETHGLEGAALAPGLTSPTQALVEIPSEFDRTHVLNAVAAFDLGAGWRAGARFVYYTGRPYSPEIRGVPAPPYNSLRLPDFYRIDVRLEKRWHAFGTGYVSLVLEGMNVTLNKEAISVTCNNDGSLAPLKYDTCSPQLIGPVSVPSIGVEGGI